MNEDYWYNQNKDGSTCLVYKLGDVYFTSIKSRIKYFTHQQQMQLENDRLMREREFKQRPKSVHANNYYRNDDSNNLIMVKSLQDSLQDDRVLMHNYNQQSWGNVYRI